MGPNRKLALILLVLMGCGGGGGTAADSTSVGVASRTIADEPSAVIDAQRGAVLGVRVGMPADTVKQLLGTPTREGTDLSDSLPVTLLEFPIGTVRVRGSTGVVGFLCGGDDCRTVDGVGIGDSSDVILSSYGPTPPRGPFEAPEALDYRLGTTDCNLTFTLASGRVTSLELGCAAR
ncbi:MAG: hypothetical protein ABIQ41_00135 [Gemmatimonadales bacterium]